MTVQTNKLIWERKKNRNYIFFVSGEVFTAGTASTWADNNNFRSCCSTLRSSNTVWASCTRWCLRKKSISRTGLKRTISHRRRRAPYTVSDCTYALVVAIDFVAAKTFHDALVGTAETASDPAVRSRAAFFLAPKRPKCVSANPFGAHIPASVGLQRAFVVVYGQKWITNDMK